MTARNPEISAARAMAEAFNSKQDIYYSGLYAYQQAGGKSKQFLRRYSRILERAAHITLQNNPDEV